MEQLENRRVLGVGRDEAILRQLKGIRSGSTEEGDAFSFDVDSAPSGASALERVRRSREENKPYAAVCLTEEMGGAAELFAWARGVWEFLPEASIVLCVQEGALSSDGILRELGVSDNLLILSKPLSNVAIAQAMIAVVTKWNYAAWTRQCIEDLERTVENRTQELNQAIRQLVSTNNALKLSIQKTQETQQRMMESRRLAALGEMAGGMAHEINTPLATIRLAAEQIADLMDEPAVDRGLAKKLLNSAGDSIRRIAAIVTGLRNVAREGCDDPLKAERVAKIMSDVLLLSENRLKAEGIELVIGEIPQDLEVMCRAVQIGQVLLNLLNNSKDAVAPLSERWIKVSVEDGEDRVAIAIEDSGPGISREIQKRLFQPFFTTKPIGKGTGLGLSVSKGIVESQGGILELDQSCKNTRMVVRLSKAQKREKVA